MVAVEVVDGPIGVAAGAAEVGVRGAVDPDRAAAGPAEAMAAVVARRRFKLRAPGRTTASESPLMAYSNSPIGVADSCASRE